MGRQLRKGGGEHVTGHLKAEEQMNSGNTPATNTQCSPLHPGQVEDLAAGEKTCDQRRKGSF